jgi:hypothetical protein
MGFCVCVSVGMSFLDASLFQKLLMEAFVLAILPSLPIQSSALYAEWIPEKPHFVFIGNKHLRLTSERLPSKNTSGAYSSHSE